MRELVLDASVLLKWFAKDELGAAEARMLREEFEAGDLVVLAPPLVQLEVLNVAGRRWSWSSGALAALATALDDLGLELVAPDLLVVAEWIARGLTAYDAAYVAIAAQAATTLVTDDARILDVAGAMSEPLVADR